MFLAKVTSGGTGDLRVFKKLFSDVANIFETPRDLVSGIMRYITTMKPYICGAELDLTNLCQRPGFCACVCTYGVQPFVIKKTDVPEGQTENVQLIKADTLKDFQAFLENKYSVNPTGQLNLGSKPPRMSIEDGKFIYTKIGKDFLRQEDFKTIKDFFTPEGVNVLQKVMKESVINGLSIDQAKGIVDSIAALQKKFHRKIPLRLSGGGEPLLYNSTNEDKEKKNLVLELLQYIRVKEITSVTVITNGQVFKNIKGPHDLDQKNSWLKEILPLISTLRISVGNYLNEKGQDYLDSDLKDILSGLAVCIENLPPDTKKQKITLQYLLLPGTKEKAAAQSLINLNQWLQTSNNIPQALRDHQILSAQAKAAQEMDCGEKRARWPYDKYNGAYEYLHFEQSPETGADLIKINGQKLFGLLLENVMDEDDPDKMNIDDNAHTVYGTRKCHGTDFFLTIGYDGKAYSCCDMKYVLSHILNRTVENIRQFIEEFPVTEDTSKHTNKLCFFGCVLSAINRAIDRSIEGFIVSLWFSNVRLIHGELPFSFDKNHDTGKEIDDNDLKYFHTSVVEKEVLPLTTDNYYQFVRLIKKLCADNPQKAYVLLDSIYTHWPQTYLGAFNSLFYTLSPLVAENPEFQRLLNVWYGDSFAERLDAVVQLIDGTGYGTKQTRIIDQQASGLPISVQTELDNYRADRILQRIKSSKELMETIELAADNPDTKPTLSLEDVPELGNTIVASLYSRNPDGSIAHQAVLYRNDENLTPISTGDPFGIQLNQTKKAALDEAIQKCSQVEYNPRTQYLIIRSDHKDTFDIYKLKQIIPAEQYKEIETWAATPTVYAQRFMQPQLLPWSSFFPSTDYIREIPAEVLALGLKHKNEEP
jgi:hypothetical protein